MLFSVEIFISFLFPYMSPYSSIQKSVAILALTTFLTFISPISAVHAVATLTGTLEVPTPTNIVTPSYTFDSDAS